MRLPAFLAALLFASAASSGFSAGPDFPSWAFPINPRGAPAPAADDSVRRVPDSAVTFTAKEIAAIAGPVPDWHPEEHPTMPAIVARGRPPAVYSCAYCHLPTGNGRPENSNLAGLTAGYITQQMAAFKNGQRAGSAPDRLPQTMMIALAKQATDAEVREAADYFAALKPTSFVQVIEAEAVPKSVVAGWTLTAAPEGGTEPLGQRIIEMPVDFEIFENRDARSAYVAYVPPGSIKRGQQLVVTGGDGRTLQCAACHGTDLRGLVDIPRLLGRSPSYLFRQLYDFKHGSRHGVTADLMQPVVTNLTDDDMIDIVAYLASRRP